MALRKDLSEKGEQHKLRHWAGTFLTGSRERKEVLALGVE